MIALVSTIKNTCSPFLTWLFQPHKGDEQSQQKEFNLTVLLVCLSIFASIAWFDTLFGLLFLSHHYSATPLVTGGILFFLLALIGFSKRGNSVLVGYGCVSLLLIIGFFVSFQWGPDMPESLLLYSVIIISTGSILGSKKAFLISVLIGGWILFLTYLKLRGGYFTDDRWRYDLLYPGDALTYVVTLGLITLVSWLSNRELTIALARAHHSELLLTQERDQLEVLVERRTQQLKHIQTEKMLQLYRFAEFGRSASGLFHDLVNPLNLVSLNLTTLTQNKTIKQQALSDAQVALDRAVVGTKRLEKCILLARKQMQLQDLVKRFSLPCEINESIMILEHKAKQRDIHLLFTHTARVTMYGNPLKFHQVMNNLIANAIDSYGSPTTSKKDVLITLNKCGDWVEIVIQDFGDGIKKQHLANIFEPFFTTKKEKGTGIGLAITRDIVEKEFKGTISVQTKVRQGTTFLIRLPIRDKRNSTEGSRLLSYGI